MIDPNTTARAEALQVAAEWLIKLGDHDLQEADIDAWNAWMEASPLHAQAFEDVHLLWDAAAEVSAEQVLAAEHAHQQAQATALPAAPPAGPRQEPAAAHPGVTDAVFQPRSSTRTGRTRTRTRPRRWLALAASAAVLAIAVGVIQYTVPVAPAELHLSADVGTPKQLTLPDGSRVDLDAGSQLVVQFSSQRRQVELVRGQAYFSVAKDPARPFEVRADGALAQALGTHFSVARRSDSVRVVVSEGHVQVSDLRANGDGIVNHVVQLVADQSATLVDGGPLQGPVALDAGSNLAWLQGQVVYRSETLGNVVADMNRHSTVPITLENAQLAQRRVTGRWSTGDVDTWLESIAQALSLAIVRRPQGILLTPAAADTHGAGHLEAGVPLQAPARH